MPEVVLALVVVAMLVERVLAQRGWDAKERTLLNHVLAETPADLVALERAPKKPRRKRTEDDVDPRSRIPIGL